MNRTLQPAGEIAERVERLVTGADFGADGYTTVEKADELTSRLELRPSLRLLDLGSGRGWPGLYLAKTTGCQVVLTTCRWRACGSPRRAPPASGLSGRCAVVAAGGGHLPLAGPPAVATPRT